MSRNLRHRDNTPIETKTKAQKMVASDNSSDDDYAGVDLISDSEEDEPDVESAEEQAIIESEEEDNCGALQLEIDDDQSSWAGFEIDNEPAFMGDQPFFGDHTSRPASPHLNSELPSWTRAGSRRVRFDITESDTSDTEDNLFPDVFLDQSSLDPKFRQNILNDHNNDNDDPPSDVGSYWDFGSGGADGDPVEVADDNDSDSSCGSSGYETDEGETTEEDLPPAANYVPARSVLRRQSIESSTSEEDITVIRRNQYRHSLRHGPKLGSWVTDATKPFAVMDSHGKRLMMFRARISRRFSFNRTPSQPMQTITDVHDTQTTEEMSPMISNSTNMMMSAMFPPLDTLFGGQAFGPPEAFYPFFSISASGMVTQDSPSSSFEDDIDDDDLWNITDLVDFGDERTDDDGAVEDDSTSATDLPSTPIRPTTANSEDQIDPLIEHLDRGVVGAFRRNQSRHQLITRNVASRESLAFSGPYRQGTLRGIKGGRLAAATTPIAPLRKSRSTMNTDALRSTKPMEEPSADRKRKFSGEQQHGHKRTRSMV